MIGRGDLWSPATILSLYSHEALDAVLERCREGIDIALGVISRKADTQRAIRRVRVKAEGEERLARMI